MKKLLLFSIALLGFTFASSAQSISENAIGLRLGDSDGLGAEISYQHALGSSNRLELDLGWRNGNNYSAYKLTGLYQWVFPLDGDFNWYVGAGGGLASYSGKSNSIYDDQTSFFVAGDIGIEYNFDIPLMLSLDFRPEIGNNDYINNTVFDIALGIRFQF
ncbi:outer membrane beta-barrel protein [Mariniflexile aquimaris]|uniref:Outer membrane beta-barrel protein n=1 Tax=Mariniflexile aquimaris TaxID=881009 RepID=A0ABW3BU09_9FLAO